MPRGQRRVLHPSSLHGRLASDEHEVSSYRAPPPHACPYLVQVFSLGMAAQSTSLWLMIGSRFPLQGT